MLVIIAVRTVSRVLFFTPGRLVEARVKQDLFEHLLQLQQHKRLHKPKKLNLLHLLPSQRLQHLLKPLLL